ncbi:glyoxylate/hydroxypyruvate reductase A-like [Haliotis rubra]|uniref:glyoxylate/hydroxypyruvate reductase A-like n=1 Tax=Haliotis rubra TaxID=36100 RepID=UPI001EE56F8C|nr:glyoxylate/hydroxypyruvate reductase A-like [Haliotis rubra]XP_046547030.1 glyoxylate/hydroxypyruvate reductase A-like [Haliotis rubra]
MPSPKVAICYPTTDLFEIIKRELPDADVQLFTKPLSDNPKEEEVAFLSQVEVLFGSPRMMVDVIPLCTSLKWIQLPQAGADKILHLVSENTVKKNIIVTRNGESFAKPLAEHIMCQILTTNKGHYKWYDQQKRAVYERESIHSKPLSLTSVGILGLGCIGREAARTCKFFGMKVWGMTRTEVKEDKKSPYVDEYRTESSLHEILSECDYIVSILPSTEQTRGLLSGDAFSYCKNKKTTFINVGRGDVTDEESILKALRNKWLQYAALDVHNPEPLPASSPLWSEPGVIITPHISGGLILYPGYQEDRAELFVKQYRRYVNNEPLEYVVDVDRGY